MLWGVIVGRHGWRPAVLVVAGASLLLMPLVALLMRDRPEDIGLRPLGGGGNSGMQAAVDRPFATACGRATSGSWPGASSSAA